MANFILKTKETVLLVLIQIFIFIIIIFSKVYSDPQNLKLLYLILIILQILSCFVLYWLFKRTTKQIEEETKQTYMEKQHELQNEHLLVTQELDRNFDFIREDLKKEIENIQLNDALDMNSIRQITANLMEKYKALYHINYCENKIVDAILYNKTTKAKAMEIPTQVQVILPDVLPIQDLDLISIYANLLDNAIEANEKLEPSKRFLAISSAVKNGKLFIKVENHKRAGEAVLPGSGFTSKKKNVESHGFGLQIIQSTVESYGGVLQVEDLDEMVKITAFLDVSIRSN